MTFALLIPMLLAAEDVGSRLDVLKFHLERLEKIAVPAAEQARKDEKFEMLRRALGAGARSGEQINDLYLKMDEVRQWLWKNAAEQPRVAEGSFEEHETEWVVRNPVLELRVDRVNLGMTVRTPRAAWRFMPSDEFDVETSNGRFPFTAAQQISASSFPTGYSVGMVLSLGDFAPAPGATFILCMNLIGNEIVFELAAIERDLDLIAINWPKAIVTGNDSKDLAVIPLMQGMLLPGDWPVEIRERNLCNSRSLYMPWWGQIDGATGAGVQTILETSDDAGASYEHPPGGPTVIRPRWYSSLGKVRYQRVARYVFDDESRYVRMAKRYRRFARETGRFVSIEEKRARTPNVSEVIGRPVVHIGSLYHNVEQSHYYNRERLEQNHNLTTFDQLSEGLRGLRERGIADAYVHLDGWGYYGYDNGHPDVLPPGEEQGGWEGLRRFADTCQALGYLFAVHDQYRDFYFSAVSFDDRLAAYRHDGTREEHSTWCGGPQTILSPRFAPEYVRRNHDLLAAHRVDVKGAYLDVFSVVPLEESSQEFHPLTRTDCARYRQECFDLLRARGYVVSSEEPTDYLCKHLDLVHHGPYSIEHSGGARGVPIPLWNLVYHDALLLPWDMGEDGGWGIPKGDAGFLHCFLNAGLPYVGLSPTETQVARINEAIALNSRCAGLEMTNHEFLEDTRRKQRTTFADGTTVEVDFDGKTYRIRYP